MSTTPPITYPNACREGINELLERLSRLAREDYLAGPSNRHYVSARQFLVDAGVLARLDAQMIDAQQAVAAQHTKQKVRACARRSNHHVTWQGKTLTVTDWAARTGIKRSTLCMRLKQGWPLERVFEVVR